MSKFHHDRFFAVYIPDMDYPFHMKILAIFPEMWEAKTFKYMWQTEYDPALLTICMATFSESQYPTFEDIDEAQT